MPDWQEWGPNGDVEAYAVDENDSDNSYGDARLHPYNSDDDEFEYDTDDPHGDNILPGQLVPGPRSVL